MQNKELDIQILADKRKSQLIRERARIGIRLIWLAECFLPLQGTREWHHALPLGKKVAGSG